VDVHFADGRNGFQPQLAEPNIPHQMVPVPSAKQCVTEVTLTELRGSGVSVNVTKKRAFVAAVTPQVVEARLTYLGHTRNVSRLDSVAMCEQFGPKLRAHDASNLAH